MTTTESAQSGIASVDLQPRSPFFLDSETARKISRLNFSRFTDRLLERVVSAEAIRGHLDPEHSELFDLYCDELFEAIGDEPFVLLPESDFSAVIITALNDYAWRNLQGMARRPARKCA